MRKTVYKYDLGLPDMEPQVLRMPIGAEILSVHTQRDGPSLWALVDSDAPPEDRKVYLVGTGWPVPAGAGRVVGTVLMHGGGLVFHAFEAARQ